MHWGLDPRMIGLIYAGFTMPFFFVSFFVGRHIDRRGAKGATIAGLFLIALSTIGLGLTQNPKILFIFSLVSGIGDALLLPGIMSVIDRLSSYRAKERISGVKTFAESTGYFAGPLVAGVASSFFGFSSTFIYLGMAILVLACITLFLPLRLSGEEELSTKAPAFH